ncbi:MAG: amidohydrolase family protein [Desulfobulbaceae bacterium]|nr:amidohydrolase family protein [Desulfobulbaceae bacterium]
MKFFLFSRRLFLASLGAGMVNLLAHQASAHLWNPCLATSLPPPLADHPALKEAWQGIDSALVWDCHAHLAGTGDSDSGITLSPEMTSLLHPLQFAQQRFFLNAGCTDQEIGRVDQSYVERLRHQLAGMAPGVKLMLLAFDQAHDESGQALPEKSALYVPNAYACELARNYPQQFEGVASIHPCRHDAVATLEEAKCKGARAVKWLPSAMGIDPAASYCDNFYRVLARLDLPLISHAGEEKALRGLARFEYNNPLRLRRALAAGVRVVIAHCASDGKDDDLDNGGRSVASFALFTRMMDDPAHRERLFADISAITLYNRSLAVVRTIIERDDWHPRLLNGSDYPLPGVLPLTSPATFARAGMLDHALLPMLAELRDHNSLLFDFVLKRHLLVGKRRLPANIFETRRFFTKEQS